MSRSLSIETKISRCRAFIHSCRADVADYRLTPKAEPTAYARCFAVFALHLIGARDVLDSSRDALTEALYRDIRARRALVGSKVPQDKAFRQLLCFTLSALTILDALDEDPLVDLVTEQMPTDIAAELSKVGAFQGLAQSGNQAMFLAIFLLHMRRYTSLDTGEQLASWLGLHIATMNRFGFWGPDRGSTHLQFQNGYHQYEIFEYMRATIPRQMEAVSMVASLADETGHFAPYPGGGACFDYDAVFILTSAGGTSGIEDNKSLLERTAQAIANEQQLDGGFCESLCVRPRHRNWHRFVKRAYTADNLTLFRERLRYSITLQRAKHDRISTHWSNYSRQWNESNLWDSYFRMLTIARIDCALNPKRAEKWGFIDYPGIGWHPSLRTVPEQLASAHP